MTATRGCVAVGDMDSWKGLYKHQDSFPTNLGKDVWDVLQNDYNGDIRQMCEAILNYDNWDNYKKHGICEYCGQKGKGHPTDVKHEIYEFNKPSLEEKFEKLPEDIRINIEKTGLPDPESKYHKHAKLTDKITSKAPDPLFIEWLYILNPKNKTFVVMSRRMDDEFSPGDCKTSVKKDKDGFFNYGNCRCKHGLVIVLDIAKGEPDWLAIQKMED